MQTETIEIVSVSGGKFHRPDNTTFNGGGKDIRDPRLMRCGRSLVPLNFYQTIADADRYTGGRLERFICQQCERKVSHLWRVPEVLKNGTPTTKAKTTRDVLQTAADQKHHDEYKDDPNHRCAGCDYELRTVRVLHVRVPAALDGGELENVLGESYEDTLDQQGCLVSVDYVGDVAEQTEHPFTEDKAILDFLRDVTARAVAQNADDFLFYRDENPRTVSLEDLRAVAGQRPTV